MNSRNPKFNSRYFWSYRRGSWVHRQILWSMGQGGHRDSAPREIVVVLDRRRMGTVVWIPSSWRSKRTISKYKRFQWTKISIQAETDDSSRHFTYLSIYSSCHLEINSTIKSTTIVISSDFSCVKLSTWYVYTQRPRKDQKSVGARSLKLAHKGLKLAFHCIFNL